MLLLYEVDSQSQTTFTVWSEKKKQKHMAKSSTFNKFIRIKFIVYSRDEN